MKTKFHFLGEIHDKHLVFLADRKMALLTKWRYALAAGNYFYVSHDPITLIGL